LNHSQGEAPSEHGFVFSTSARKRESLVSECGAGLQACRVDSRVDAPSAS
jgi:hypothetical protein